MKRRTFMALTLATALAALARPTWADEKLGGEINILSWGNYIDFALKPFTEKYGVKVNIDYYADEHEAMNKIRAAGLGSYDVVFLGAGFEDVAMKQALIEPLDVSKLANFKDLYPLLQKPKPDGRHYCAVYSWGTNALIAYNPSKTGAPIKSWKDVFSGKYKGRVGKIDKPDEQVWRTALMAGIPYGSLNDQQWKTTQELLLKNMTQVRTIYEHNDQMAQLMGSGEIWIADTDDGSFRQAKAKGLNIELAYPAEGMTAWYDGPCVIKEAPHPAAAYAFIDHMLSPEMQAKLGKELGYNPANSKAINLMDDATKKNLGLEEMVKNIDKIEFQRDLGADFNTRAIELWQKAKTQAQLK
jgi:spermidine/putrescine transport system substrate-binding protein